MRRNETEPQPKSAVRMPLTTPATGCGGPNGGTAARERFTRGKAQHTRSDSIRRVSRPCVGGRDPRQVREGQPLIASMQQAFNLLSVAANNEMMLFDAEEFYNFKRGEVDRANAGLEDVERKQGQFRGKDRVPIGPVNRKWTDPAA